MSIKKIFWIILGCIGVGLGAVGAVVPMLPHRVRSSETSSQVRARKKRWDMNR